MAAQSNSLQSIRYKRGSLELLDQVSLLSFLSLIHVCLFLFMYYVYVSINPALSLSNLNI